VQCMSWVNSFCHKISCSNRAPVYVVWDQDTLIVFGPKLMYITEWCYLIVFFITQLSSLFENQEKLNFRIKTSGKWNLLCVLNEAIY
jgi:hypothetical protein